MAWKEIDLMLLVAIAWMYVVLMVALAQATGADGSLLRALATVLFCGVLPLGILGYLFFSPARRRARRRADAESAGAPGLDPDERGHPAGEPVAPVREEP